MRWRRYTRDGRAPRCDMRHNPSIDGAGGAGGGGTTAMSGVLRGKAARGGGGGSGAAAAHKPNTMLPAWGRAGRQVRRGHRRIQASGSRGIARRGHVVHGRDDRQYGRVAAGGMGEPPAAARGRTRGGLGGHVARQSPEAAVPIPDMQRPRRIAYVDGGNATLLGSPGWSVGFNRVAYAVCQGRTVHRPLYAQRVDFLSLLAAEPASGSGGSGAAGENGVGDTGPYPRRYALRTIPVGNGGGGGNGGGNNNGCLPQLDAHNDGTRRRPRPVRGARGGPRGRPPYVVHAACPARAGGRQRVRAGGPAAPALEVHVQARGAAGPVRPLARRRRARRRSRQHCRKLGRPVVPGVRTGWSARTGMQGCAAQRRPCTAACRSPSSQGTRWAGQCSTTRCSCRRTRRSTGRSGGDDGYGGRGGATRRRGGRAGGRRPRARPRRVLHTPQVLAENA